MKKTIDKLIDVAEKIDAVELTRAWNEYVVCTKNNSTSTKQIGQRKAVRKYLKELIDEFNTKYFPEPDDPDGKPLERVWPNKKRAWEFLRTQGFVNPKTGKFGRSSFYKDFKGKGEVKESDLQMFIANAGLVRDGEVSGATGTPGMLDEKLKEEVEKLKINNEKQKIELDALRGKYIPRPDVWLELAGRATVLDAGLRTFFQSAGPKIIEVVGGDLGRLPELLELVNMELDAQMNQFAESKTFQIEFQSADYADGAD